MVPAADAPSRHYLGVDGGGTRTRAAIVGGGGRLLGYGEGGPSNYDDVGVERAREGIRAAVDGARAAAGLAGEPFAAAFLGLAGLVSDEDRRIAASIAASLELAPPAVTGVDHDIRIALAGGLAGRAGITLIMGTGSSCYGRNARGESWRAGGWGHLISDEGSGYWLGREAIRATSRAADGRGEATTLSGRILARLGVAHPDDLLHRLYVVGLSRPEIAALATEVIAAAGEGDRTATALLEEGGGQLAECVLAVSRKLGFAGAAHELVPVGGLTQAGESTLGPLERALARVLPECRVVPPALPPVLGAALLALESAGHLAEGVIARLKESAASLS